MSRPNPPKPAIRPRKQPRVLANLTLLTLPVLAFYSGQLAQATNLTGLTGLACSVLALLTAARAGTSPLLAHAHWYAVGTAVILGARVPSGITAL